jgi:hypothetical protein
MTPNNFTRNPDDVTCDFCRAMSAVWSYQTKVVERLNHFDTTPWQACETCASCIEAERYTALIERALDGHSVLETDRALWAWQYRLIYKMFREVRTGPRCALPRVTDLTG